MNEHDNLIEEALELSRIPPEALMSSREFSESADLLYNMNHPNLFKEINESYALVTEAFEERKRIMSEEVSDRKSALEKLQRINDEQKDSNEHLNAVEIKITELNRSLSLLQEDLDRARKISAQSVDAERNRAEKAERNNKIIGVASLILALVDIFVAIIIGINSL